VDSFFRYENAGLDEGVIDIYTEQVANPIPRALFGKFTEHLGSNIYNGMWAQILRNPEFEPPTILGRQGKEWLERRRPAERAFGDVALYWLPRGEGRIEFSFDRDCVSPPHSQKIEIKSVVGSETGLMQQIFLPLHRERKYELTLWAKGKGLKRGITITIQNAATNEVLCKTQLPHPTEEWQTHRADLDVKVAPRGAALDFIISVAEPGTLWLDHMTLFPKDNVAGFDTDVLRLLRAARLPLLRWPGGNFSSGYHWEDGIGPTEKRPTLRNPARRNQIECNHVGTDEFIAFCRQVPCEPLICVNAGNGTPEEAAHWVEYCNGDVSTQYGAMRAANGHPEPYDIIYWEIGNELYGNWQIGQASAEEYADRYRRFYDAMKAIDPRIKFIACGKNKNWNAPLIKKNAGILRSVSLHSLVGRNMNKDYSPRETFETLMAYTWHYDQELGGLGEQMASRVSDPRIAVTELQIFVQGLAYPTNSTMAEALFFSGILHSCIRQGDLVEMITHSALVNHGGGLRKYKEIVYANPVHWAHHLYGNQPGSRPVRLDVRCAQFNVPRRIWPAVEAVPYLDPVALLDESGDVLCVIVSNRHPERALKASIVLHGFESERDVEISQIKADSFISRNTLEEPDKVRLTESSAHIEGTRLTYTFPAHSLTALQFRR